MAIATTVRDLESGSLFDRILTENPSQFLQNMGWKIRYVHDEFGDGRALSTQEAVAIMKAIAALNSKSWLHNDKERA